MLTDPRNPPIAGHESAWSEASNVKHLIPFCARSYSDSFCYSYFMFELKSTAQASLFQFVYLDYSSTSRRLHHTWLIQEWDTYFTHRDNSAGTGDPAYGKRWVSHGMRRIREYLRLHVYIFLCPWIFAVHAIWCRFSVQENSKRFQRRPWLDANHLWTTQKYGRRNFTNFWNL